MKQRGCITHTSLQLSIQIPVLWRDRRPHSSRCLHKPGHSLMRNLLSLATQPQHHPRLASLSTSTFCPTALERLSHIVQNSRTAGSARDTTKFPISNGLIVNKARYLALFYPSHLLKHGILLRLRTLVSRFPSHTTRHMVLKTNPSSSASFPPARPYTMIFGTHIT